MPYISIAIDLESLKIDEYTLWDQGQGMNQSRVLNTNYIILLLYVDAMLIVDINLDEINNLKK